MQNFHLSFTSVDPWPDMFYLDVSSPFMPKLHYTKFICFKTVY